MSTRDDNGQIELKKLLNSIVEVNPNAQPQIIPEILNKNLIVNGNGKNNITVPAPVPYNADYSKHRPVRSKSSDPQDDYLESILNAKDRRLNCWTQVRSQKSYAPSISAICKLNKISFLKFDISKFWKISNLHVNDCRHRLKASLSNM